MTESTIDGIGIHVTTVTCTAGFTTLFSGLWGAAAAGVLAAGWAGGWLDFAG